MSLERNATSEEAFKIIGGAKRDSKVEGKPESQPHRHFRFKLGLT